VFAAAHNCAGSNEKPKKMKNDVKVNNTFIIPLFKEFILINCSYNASIINKTIDDLSID